jgi:hypothetical protein
MIQSIRSFFQCDSCGRESSVSIRPAYLPPATWTLMDIAVDAVRRGCHYRGPMLAKFHLGTPSVAPNGDQLCDVCSSEASQ